MRDDANKILIVFEILVVVSLVIIGSVLGSNPMAFLNFIMGFSAGQSSMVDFFPDMIFFTGLFLLLLGVEEVRKT